MQNGGATAGAEDGARDLGHLLPEVYEDLRRIASEHLAREAAGHTLQPTALVNEVYLRFAGRDVTWVQERPHVLALAARAMRQVLIDHARRRRTAKREGKVGQLPLFDSVYLPATDEERSPVDLLVLEEALERLENYNPQHARIVELRFFAGLTIEEAAAELGVAVSTLNRTWKAIRLWLTRELG